MSAAALIGRAKLLRTVLEALQPGLRSLTLDIQQAAQTARLLGGSDKVALLAVADETTEAYRAVAAGMGCLDDALTGLETAAMREAHPDATDEEMDKLLREMTR